MIKGSKRVISKGNNTRPLNSGDKATCTLDTLQRSTSIAAYQSIVKLEEREWEGMGNTWWRRSSLTHPR